MRSAREELASRPGARYLPSIVTSEPPIKRRSGVCDPGSTGTEIVLALGSHGGQ
jgi:hypothetical protein